VIRGRGRGGRSAGAGASLRRSAPVLLATLASAGVLVASVHCGGDSGNDLVMARRTRGGASGAAGKGLAAGTAGSAGAGDVAGAAGGGLGLGGGAAGLAGAAGDTLGGAAGGGSAGEAGAAAAGGGSAGEAGATAAGEGGATAAGMAGAGDTNAGAAGSGGADPGGTGGVAGSTSNPIGESACADGVDNDQDGQPDCADTDCVGRSTCLPTVPSDWTGPLTTTKRPASVDPAPCASGSAPKRRYATTGNPVHCSTCECGAREGASCTLGSVEIASGIPGNTTCAGVGPVSVGAASCGEFDAPTDPPGLAVRASLNEVKGTCPPSGGSVDNRPAIFQESYDTCPLAAGGLGCGTGTCVPLTTEAQTCIVHTGVDASCPAGWNTRILVFDDADDTRGCTPCTCEDPATVCGKAQLTLHKAAGCATDPAVPKATVEVDGACTFLNVSQSFPGVKWHLVPSGVGVNATTCTPAGGQPTGEISPKAGSVLCCL
jgi:hypothetical protein